jgi:flagellar export protein FliJ
MKKQSLEILCRYRKHLLEKEQIALQDRIADENQQKLRLVQLQARVQATHNAKGKATSVEELRALDEAAAYLHSRLTLAKRGVALCGQARQDAVEQTLKMKQSLDQIGLLLEKGRLKMRAELDERERKEIDELVTSRYAMALRGV